MTTKIIIDSACDLPKKIIEEYEMEVLPFNIHIDNKTYYDGKDIEIEDVYSALRTGKVPTTSQVSPEVFKNVFTNNAEKGNDCIYISFSAEMSGAYQTGKIIAAQVENDFPETNIDVVDSKAGSVATGIIAYSAALLIKQGVIREKVIEKIKYWAEHIKHLFILDNLKTLERGGRLSKTKSFIGSILNIKPILHVNNGKIELLEKARGTTRSINRLLGLFKEQSYNIKDQIIGIAHADDIEKAKILKEKIEELGGEVFCIEKIGSVLGVHLGIGGIGVFFLPGYEYI